MHQLPKPAALALVMLSVGCRFAAANVRLKSAQF
jgi:hypothetical protein